MLRNHLKGKMLHDKRPTYTSDDERLSLKSEFISYLEQLDINDGDILILHTSMDEISKTGVDAISLIKYFINRVGENGTLAIPTFPLYPNSNEDVLLYDKLRTPCWTGLLPNIFLRYPGVVRSEFPYNTLAAYGKHSKEMMQDNLVDNMAFGPHSSWAYCVNNHAKVLLLGTPAFHTTTIAHIPEDIMGNSWPIKEFHYKQKFILKNNNKENDYYAYLRRPIWASYLKSHYRTRILRNHRLLIEGIHGGVYVGYIEDASKVVNFLTQRALNKKTMYYVPRKYRK